MTMLHQLSRKWHRLRDSRAGTRFQNYYRRTRRERNRDERAPRFARMIAAAVLLMTGLLLLVFPLIYVPFFVASAALFASESLKFARFLDRSELRVRTALRRTRHRYRLSHRTVRLMKVTVGVGCLVFSGFVCYSAYMGWP
jgi:hypothetical protein